jgi:hypothetical protein
MTISGFSTNHIICIFRALVLGPSGLQGLVCKVNVDRLRLLDQSHNLYIPGPRAWLGVKWPFLLSSLHSTPLHSPPLHFTSLHISTVMVRFGTGGPVTRCQLNWWRPRCNWVGTEMRFDCKCTVGVCWWQPYPSPSTTTKDRRPSTAPARCPCPLMPSRG